MRKSKKPLFKTSKLEPGTTYTVTIESEVTDMEGNSMDKDFSWRFTTFSKEMHN